MLVWVLGAGGLLGRGIRHALQTRKDVALFDPPEPRLPWKSSPALREALPHRVRMFFGAVEASQDSWAIAWCAGGSVVASPPADVSADVTVWDLFLGALEVSLAEVSERARSAGRMLLASSAGGVWAGHVGSAITESTPPHPISLYGRGHLDRERALAVFAARWPCVRTVVVRFSNLYGVAQRLDKPQGLVSHIARSLIHRRPIHIFVPLDTVRDYVLADDAGEGVADVLDELGRCGVGEPPRLKVLASEDEVSIGGLLALFRRVARRPVVVTSGLDPSAHLQPLHLRFRSTVWSSAGRARRTPLHEGVAQVYRHQLAQFTLGRLPPPAL